MIAITASEKKPFVRSFLDVHIVRTMKQDSKRHHYYMVEDGAPMKPPAVCVDWSVFTTNERGV